MTQENAAEVLELDAKNIEENFTADGNSDEKKTNKHGYKSKFSLFALAEKKVFAYTIGQLALYAIFGAFCGYAGETIGRVIDKGIIDGRYMFMPFIFGYGVGVVLAYLVFDRPSNMRIFGLKILPQEKKRNKVLRSVIFYLTAFCIITFCEWGFGALVEAITGQQLWNYNGIPLHFTQYVSLPTSLAFTTGVFVIMEFVTPALMKFFEKILNKKTIIVAFALLALMFADTAFMMLRLFIAGHAPQNWQIILPWATV